MSKLQARNETIINAPANTIWAIITDISLLPKVNPGVVKASGRMDRQGETRTCDINNKGRKGTMTERLVELVPETKTVWTIENDRRQEVRGNAGNPEEAAQILSRGIGKTFRDGEILESDPGIVQQRRGKSMRLT